MPPDQVVCNVPIQPVYVPAIPDIKGPNVMLPVVVMVLDQAVQHVISLRVNVLAIMVILAPHVQPKQVRFLSFITNETQNFFLLTDPTYIITCQISISGVDLTSNCASNTGSCLIVAATGGFDVLTVPACSTSVSSTRKFLAGTYFVQANANVGGTAYSTSSASPISITSSDVTVNLQLS